MKYLSLSLICLLLASCSAFRDKNDRPPLEGERISIMELQKTLEPDQALAQETEFILPKPWKNAYWPQAGGYPNHAMQNLALPETQLNRTWKVDIGQGSTKRLPLTSHPIVVDGQIFTLDSDFSLRAFNITNGKLNWKRNVNSQFEDDSVISGGIAYGEGKVFITNGYNEVLAVDPNDGKIIWRKAISTPARAAPTIVDGRVFVVTLDARVIALNIDDGSVLWEYIGISESAGLVGAASPAASRDVVVPVFSSGEITALRVGNGSVAWTDNLAPIRRFGGLSSISDIKALPVIDREIVFAISFAGRLVAIDQRTGTRIWQRDIGGSNTPWIAGNHLFVLTADNELLALQRETGAIRWINPLPKYRDPEDKSGVLFWTGPVLAGNRLIVASTDGRITEIDASDGETRRSWETGDNIIMPPIVADNTLYILSEDGRLAAYR